MPCRIEIELIQTERGEAAGVEYLASDLDNPLVLLIALGEGRRNQTIEYLIIMDIGVVLFH